MKKIRTRWKHTAESHRIHRGGDGCAGGGCDSDGGHSGVFTQETIRNLGGNKDSERRHIGGYSGGSKEETQRNMASSEAPDTLNPERKKTYRSAWEA